MAVFALVLLVVAIVVVCTDQLERGDEWFYVAVAVIFVVFAFIVGIVLYSPKQNDVLILKPTQDEEII